MGDGRWIDVERLIAPVGEFRISPASAMENICARPSADKVPY